MSASAHESITLEDPFGSCGFDYKDGLGEDIDEELYPSSNVTLMQALAILFARFSLQGEWETGDGSSEADRDEYFKKVSQLSHC